MAPRSLSLARPGSADGRRAWGRRARRRGVSDVIATILLLALTVVLFASIFFFVTSFPAPAAQNSNQFRGAIQLASNQSYITSVSILHLGGPVVPGSDTVYLKGSLQPSYVSFATPITVSSGLSGSSAWNLGQTWSFSFPTPLPRLQNITIYVVSPTQLLYSAILPGQAFYTPPVVLQTWTSPANPSVGNAFTVYAIFGGTTAGLAPTVYLGAIPGLPSTAQAMSAAGPTNEWKYLVASSLTTTNGTYPAVISGTNSQGLTGTGSLTITIANSASGSTPAFSVGVVFVPSPPNSGTAEAVQAVVTYTGTVQNAPLSVSFAGSSNPTGYTFSGSGPSGLTISGSSSETVTSQSQWTIPTPNSLYTYTVTATATVTGVGTVTGSASFEPALITLSSSSGLTGATTIVSGSAFAASTGVTFSVSKVAVNPSGCTTGTLAAGVVTTTATGTFVCTIAIPTVPSSGANSVLATDATSGQNDSATYTVTAWTLSLSSTSGLLGTTGVIATGAGYQGSSSVTLSFGGTALTPTGGTSCTHAGTTITATAAGGFACTFTVPSVASSGAYTVSGTATTGLTASATYTVTAWTLTLSTTSLSHSSTVTETMTAAGFAAGTVVYFSINGTTINPASCTTGTLAGSTVTVAASGGVVCTYAIQKVSAAGISQVFELTDASSGQSAAATLSRT